jgi:hypothetical protein
MTALRRVKGFAFAKSLYLSLFSVLAGGSNLTRRDRRMVATIRSAT